MKNGLLLLFLLMNSLFFHAQVGLSGGFNMLKGFGVPKPYAGMHLGVEIPRDDQISFYGRLSTYLPNTEQSDGTNYVYVTARDFSTIPYQQQLFYKSTMNYTIIEGGSRYYIGDGYDSGFGAYGGSNFSIVFNSIKRKYDDYDQVKYELPSTELPKGAIFNVGVGLSGGVKHTFAGVGTIYFDVNFSYMLLSQPSNTTAQMTNSYSPLIFNFGLGFRKELY